MTDLSSSWLNFFLIPMGQGNHTNKLLQISQFLQFSRDLQYSNKTLQGNIRLRWVTCNPCNYNFRRNTSCKSNFLISHQRWIYEQLIIHSKTTLQVLKVTGKVFCMEIRSAPRIAVRIYSNKLWVIIAMQKKIAAQRKLSDKAWTSRGNRNHYKRLETMLRIIIQVLWWW